MAQDDEFFIDGRTSKRSGSQGLPKARTSKGGSSSQPIVKLGNLPGGSMSFTKRLAKDMAIAKRSSGRRTYVKPSKPKTGRFNARGRGRSALAAGIDLSLTYDRIQGYRTTERSLPLQVIQRLSKGQKNNIKQNEEMVPEPGFEPGTHGFSIRCSTN